MAGNRLGRPLALRVLEVSDKAGDESGLLVATAPAAISRNFRRTSFIASSQEAPMAAACYPSFASVRMEATTGAAKRGGSIRCANFIALRHSACGPGCVKSRTGQKYVESISLLPSREGGYGTVRLLNRRNREGSSKRKLNFRLFTQPGPGTGVPPGLLSDSHPSVSGRRAGISEPSNNPLPRAL